MAAGQPEPEFEEQAGAVVVRFRPSGYHPPLRVSQALSERQRQMLLTLSSRKEWTFPEIYKSLDDPPSERTVRMELQRVEWAGPGRLPRTREVRQVVAQIARRMMPLSTFHGNRRQSTAIHGNPMGTSDLDGDTMTEGKGDI